MFFIVIARSGGIRLQADVGFLHTTFKRVLTRRRRCKDLGDEYYIQMLIEVVQFTD
jgi:hypothetical protein